MLQLNKPILKLRRFAS